MFSLQGEQTLSNLFTRQGPTWWEMGAEQIW